MLPAHSIHRRLPGSTVHAIWVRFCLSGVKRSSPRLNHRTAAWFDLGSSRSKTMQFSVFSTILKGPQEPLARNDAALFARALVSPSTSVLPVSRFAFGG